MCNSLGKGSRDEEGKTEERETEKAGKSMQTYFPELVTAVDFIWGPCLRGLTERALEILGFYPLAHVPRGRQFLLRANRYGVSTLRKRARAQKRPAVRAACRRGLRSACAGLVAAPGAGVKSELRK